MAPFSMLVVYLLIWWVTLFAVLPMGVRGQAEENNIVKGTEPGAPVDSQMKRKVIMTTLVATLIWVVVCAVIIFDLVSWETFALYKGE